MTTQAIERGVIAVVRVHSSTDALTIARGLAAAPLAGIEITMTVPDAPRVIATLVAEGVQRVGAGTIRTVEEVKACTDAGASFLVSPHLDPALVEAAIALGTPVVPGALTPSEIVHALDLGASAVKIFPVSALGGLTYVETVLVPLPAARLVVSGEVQLDEVAGYLSAGAWATCIGSSLWRGSDVAKGDSSAIAEFAQQELAKALL